LQPAIINPRRFGGRRNMKGREEEKLSCKVAKNTEGIKCKWEK
jgi:hypothetical protein